MGSLGLIPSTTEKEKRLSRMGAMIRTPSPVHREVRTGGCTHHTASNAKEPEPGALNICFGSDSENVSSAPGKHQGGKDRGESRRPSCILTPMLRVQSLPLGLLIMVVVLYLDTPQPSQNTKTLSLLRVRTTGHSGVLF